LFPQVFANGYVPIPNLDKRCMLTGWPTVLVDERQVRRWARQRKWPAIGLRMTPPLLVIDIDVLDADIAAQIERLVPPDSLRRIGQAPKAARFMRLAGEPFRIWRTRRWSPDPSAVKPQWSHVEVFGGGGDKGAQVGVFGPHKTNDAGEVLSNYAWPDGRDPSNTPLASLPEISREQVNAILGEAESMFAAAGFVVDQFTRGGQHRVKQVYDLTPEMVFRSRAGDTWDLAGLETEARYAKTIGRKFMITGSFTNDPNSAGSERGIVNLSHFDRVCIHDTKTAITHNPADIEPPSLDDAFSDLPEIIGGVLDGYEPSDAE